MQDLKRRHAQPTYDLNGMDTIRSRMSERMREDSETWHNNDRRDLESQLGTLPRNLGSPNRANNVIMNGEVLGKMENGVGHGTLQRHSKKEGHHPKTDVQADF